MHIDELIERSKQSFELKQDHIVCSNVDVALIKVQEKPNLLLEPIWLKPVDALEGPLYQKYIKKNPAYQSLFLRQTVADNLYAAASNLPKHLQLVLRAGHRPLAVQTEELRALAGEYLHNHPDASSSQALEFARTYVSDPAIMLPAHCCGAAVDVDVFDITTNQLVDFGCSVNTNSSVAFLNTDEITGQQRHNRKILLKAMLLAGFAPCYTEWWHYSYGDTIWSKFYDKPQSLYGVIEPVLSK